MNLEEYLENKIMKVLYSWEDKDIYAISFLVTYNVLNDKNLPELSIGYNTERDCNLAPLHSEERWNYAYWRQNNEEVLNCKDLFERELLSKWSYEQEITNFGEPEQTDNAYDENGNYIGTGPGGLIELMYLLSEIACKLKKDDFLKKRFKSVPIIIHDLEYSWYSIEATKKANLNEESKAFIEAITSDFAF